MSKNHSAQATTTGDATANQEAREPTFLTATFFFLFFLLADILRSASLAQQVPENHSP